MGRIKPKKLERLERQVPNFQSMSLADQQKAQFMCGLGMMAAKYPKEYGVAKSFRDKVMDEINRIALDAKKTSEMTEAFYWTLLSVSVTDAVDQAEANARAAL